MRWLPVFLLVAAAACQNTSLGDDIGRPGPSRPDRPELRGFAISEVFAADGVPANHFVEVRAGAANVALDGLSICSDLACVALSGDLNANAYLAVGAAALSLEASAGEVAVVGPAPLGGTTLVDAVHAYLAWGADPAAFGTDFTERALWSGAWDGAYVPLPFPMPTGFAAAMEGGAAGCDEQSRGGAATIAEDTCLETLPVLAISEVQPAVNVGACVNAAACPPAVPCVNGACLDSWVEILNTSADSQSLYGAKVCQAPRCVVLGRADIASGERVVVRLPEPVGASGEIVLLAPGPSALDQGSDALDAYQAFVRYGSATGSLSNVAVSVGVWSQADGNAIVPRIAGESLSVDTSCPASASAWNPTFPTSGDAEPDICVFQGGECVCGADNWTSCSFPAPARRTTAVSPLVLRRLVAGTPSTLELLNNTGAPLNLSTFKLALGITVHPLPNVSIDAGATIIVDLAPGVQLSTDGEASVLETVSAVDEIRQHVQWGAPNSREHGDDAEAAGLWPHIFPVIPLPGGGSKTECALACALPTCPQGTPTCSLESITLVQGEGHSPPDYEISCACPCL